MGRLLQGVLRRRAVVEDVARQVEPTVEAVGSGGRAGAGLGGGGLGCWAAGWAGAGLAAGMGGKDVLGTSGLCLNSCKRFGVKNVR